MKIIQEIFSSKIGPYIVFFIILALVTNWISNQPEPKTIRQVDINNGHTEKLWEENIYPWDYVSNWQANRIYAVNPVASHERLQAIDSLTGKTIWDVSLSSVQEWGVRYLFENNQTVFTITTTHVNAYLASTGELLWSTKIGDGHVAIRAQEENPFIRVYYGDKIFEILQTTGEIFAVYPKDNIIWIQNNIEIHCPLLTDQERTDPSCWIGLTGVDKATGNILWKNNKAHFSEHYLEKSLNNIIFTGFSEAGICQLDPITGESLWCLPGGKISNIAIDENQVVGYFLRNDFSLVKINLLTGGILGETQFFPRTLSAEMQEQSYGYIVAVTKDSVIVSFGDSDQTFGLRANP